VAAALTGSELPAREREFVAWFGVRGIGSHYPVAVVAGAGVLTAPEVGAVTWTAIAAVVISILVHGVSASPLSRRLLVAGDSARSD
jgi:NhaP-type Na+/H+ or K+/H+ antiporter